MSEPQVRVGVGAFVFREGKFLMQQRKGSHGQGSWSVPGGHLEYGETPEITSAREVMEETGMEVANTKFAAVTNDYFEQEGKHYVTLWTISDWTKNEPSITEPEKCTGQLWVDFDMLPDPLFLPWTQLLKSDFIDDIKKELERTKTKGADYEV